MKEDASLEMIESFLRRGGIDDLKQYYPHLCKNDDVISTALKQILVAELAIEKRVEQLYGEYWDDIEGEK
jgi:hypothetical protein